VHLVHAIRAAAGRTDNAPRPATARRRPDATRRHGDLDDPDRAFLGLSHRPLLGLNPVAPEVEADIRDALARVRDAIRAWAPDRIVRVGPDHYNGFFNELMPPFCLGTAATAVGDYGTPEGPLNVPADEAERLAAWLMDREFDVALSRRMQVDHGFAQALQVVWAGLDTPPVIPLFVNAVAQPGIPRVRRCARLGEAIGAWLDTLPGRTLVIGWGGLSREPPVPTLAHPDPAVRERITVRSTQTQAERDAKTERVMAAGMALAAGDPAIRPFAPDWDARWMDAIERGDRELAGAVRRPARRLDALLARLARPAEAALRAARQAVVRHIPLPQPAAGRADRRRRPRARAARARGRPPARRAARGGRDRDRLRCARRRRAPHERRRRRRQLHRPTAPPRRVGAPAVDAPDCRRPGPRPSLRPRRAGR
jgi:2,3-dihydroxyphenylpropionate 1,2-dioxygenase